MTTILFGSISTLADTSELQREAFNRAFAEHGLDWSWDRDEYRDLLRGNGGARRIADVASERGEQVDAEAVHATKSRLFQERVVEAPPAARPGVVETIKDARDRGDKVGLVTTTTPENVSALLTALAPELGDDAFDLVLDLTDVAETKPDPAVYRLAVERLGVQVGDCVAVEDNTGGVESATAAGIPCLAFPNENTAGHDFARATSTVERISLAGADQAAGGH